MSHVVPDLVQKIVKGQDPLHILGDGNQVRHYTYGGDLARGIGTRWSIPRRCNDDFNLSTAESTTVLELAEVIWDKIHRGDKPFRWVSDPGSSMTWPEPRPRRQKAKRVLGFEATTSLDTMLDEVVPWVAQAVADGTI